MADEPGIKVKCQLCGEPLREPGALVFGPPIQSSPAAPVHRDEVQHLEVVKLHICVGCWNRSGGLLEFLLQRLCVKA